MKTIQLLLVLCLCCSLAKAQDTILKTDQTEVTAKVTEITTDEVKFKYFNRLDGPTYALKKSDIFVIVYQDGTREKFNSAVVKSTPIAAPYYPQTSATQPASTLSTARVAATESAVKRTGWTANIGYTTPVQAFGKASGITYGAGYYFLRSGGKAGLLVDIDVMNFFGEGSPNYGILALNGIFRTSESSNFYLGGGVGYATVSVKVKDRFGNQSTASSGDLGGKAFVGYGAFRLGVVWPSFESTSKGGLLTVGLNLNPFH